MLKSGRLSGRIISALLALSLLMTMCFASFASAQERTLSPDATPYDPEHPESLKAEQLLAESAILVEATTGKIIFEKNADQQMYPASTTKILTVLLGVQYGELEQEVVLSETAADVPSDSSSIKLEVGESIKFEDLLYATLLRSGNEGANLIAETVGGNINDFVMLMNQTATAYGCIGTHFANAHGYHDDYHYTTAGDMAKIACAAMQNELFRSIAKTYTYTLPKSNIQRKRVLVMSSGGDSMLNPRDDNPYYYPGAIGIKTGFHSRAGYCYVGAAEKNGVELISVVYNTTENGRWEDTTKLFDYGFSQFVSVTPKEMYEYSPIVVETTGFSMDDTDLGRLTLELQGGEGDTSHRIIATKDEVTSMARNIRTSALVQYTRDFAAPITQGETIGTLTYYINGGASQVVYTLVAGRSIQRRENAPKSLEEIEAEVMADPNPLPPMSLELVLIFLIPVGILSAIAYMLLRLLRKGTSHRRKAKAPKPSNRYFR